MRGLQQNSRGSGDGPGLVGVRSGGSFGRTLRLQRVACRGECLGPEVLVYRGFYPPLLFALGSGECVAPLLAEISGEAELYVSVQDALLDRLAAAGYLVQDVKRMDRMVLRHDLAALPMQVRAERLGPEDATGNWRSCSRMGMRPGSGRLSFSNRLSGAACTSAFAKASNLIAAAGDTGIRAGNRECGVSRQCLHPAGPAGIRPGLGGDLSGCGRVADAWSPHDCAQRTVR